MSLIAFLMFEVFGVFHLSFSHELPRVSQYKHVATTYQHILGNTRWNTIPPDMLFVLTPDM